MAVAVADACSDLKARFRAWDASGQGVISRPVLLWVLQQMQPGMKDAHLVAAIGNCVEVRYEDFIESLYKRREPKSLNQRYEELFANIDLDDSGLMDKAELVALLQASGGREVAASGKGPRGCCKQATEVALLQASGRGDAKNAANWIMYYCDADHDGYVSLTEFKSLFQAEGERNGPEVLEKTLAWFEAVADTLVDIRCEALFKILDADASGALDKTEIYRFTLASGQPDARKAANWLMYSCDANHDDKVTLDEWRAMFRSEQERKGAKVAAKALSWFEEVARKMQSEVVASL